MFNINIRVIIQYWILIAVVLLFTKFAGLADNDEAITKILIVVTILYVGVNMLVRAKGKASK